jgi:5-formyltetrahydrofolate cyclo-ligase
MDEPARTGTRTVDKPALRRAILSRRAALPPEVRDRIAATAVEVLLPRSDGPVAAYLSVGTEPGTGRLLEALADQEVLLPVLLPDGDLDWSRAGNGFEPGPYGLLEPVGPRLGRDAIAACALIVVPALSVDQAGNRLGRGGGSYDRALARTSAEVVALLHDGEAVPALPAEPHDRPVSAFVTPHRGLVTVGTPPADRPRCAAPQEQP